MSFVVVKAGSLTNHQGTIQQFVEQIMSIEQAFNEICTEHKQAERWFVVLKESVPFYIGPEEGGTWGSDTIVIAYQEYASEELAEEAKEKVEKLAKQYTEDSRKAFGQQCLNEMEWLDKRGLDADYLPEPNGHSEYYVTVEESVPQNRYGCRHYE